MSSLLACIHAYRHTCIHACTHADIHATVHTCYDTRWHTQEGSREGSFDAMYNVGMCFRKGVGSCLASFCMPILTLDSFCMPILTLACCTSFTQDVLKFFQHSYSELRVAFCEFATGRPQDGVAAVKWFKAAAACKHPDGMYALAMSHLHGYGGASMNVCVCVCVCVCVSVRGCVCVCVRG